MNPETGEIKNLYNGEDAKQEGFTVYLSPDHHQAMVNRTHKGRKRYFRKAFQEALRKEKQRLNRRLTPSEIEAIQSKVLSN